MIDALFRFHGRLGRLAFLGWNLVAMAVVTGIVVAFVAIGAGFAALGVGSGGAASRLGLVTVLAAGSAAVWMTLALVSKRLRDIGLVPWPLLIAAALLLAVDALGLTRLTDLRFFAPFAGHTPLGGLLATGATIFLACWPGRSELASDTLVRELVIAVMVVIAVLSAALLAPLNYFVPQRHAMAQRALASGWPSVAAALLTPLAAMSDPRALNNLGVLRGRGIGTPTDADGALRLFARAAERGSARARLNGVMLPNGRCGLNVPRAATTAAALAPIADADPAAAGHIQDCLYFAATDRTLPDGDVRALAAAAQTEKSTDGIVLLHAGAAMLDRARTTQQPVYGNADDERRYDDVVRQHARKAMELLFAAADAGAPGAHEPLGILAMQFGDKLGDDPLAVRLRERSNWEWLEAGAEKGDWAAQCRVAQAQITDLRFSGKPYTRQAFDGAVASARRCIDRKDGDQEPMWHREAEWLVVTPRLLRQTRPLLDIASTEAALNGFLFFDADRKLRENTPGNAAGRKP
jgi:uncharacterized membrane protein YhaH (DUF805 family)/TPR repeat protein